MQSQAGINPYLPALHSLPNEGVLLSTHCSKVLVCHKIRSDQIRSDQIRSDQIRSGEVRWGEVRWGEVRWDEMRWYYFIISVDKLKRGVWRTVAQHCSRHEILQFPLRKKNDRRSMKRPHQRQSQKKHPYQWKQSSQTVEKNPQFNHTKPSSQHESFELAVRVFVCDLTEQSLALKAERWTQCDWQGLCVTLISRTELGFEGIVVNAELGLREQKVPDWS